MTLKQVFRMNDVLDELLAGILLFGFICQIPLLLFLRDRELYYTAGLWIGVVLAMSGGVHMAWSLDKALDLGQDGAVKKMRTDSLIRYGVALVCLGLLMIFDFASPLTGILGLMGLKVSAYLQPFLHKGFVRLGWKEDIIKPVLSPEEVDELIRREKEEKRKQSGGTQV